MYGSLRTVGVYYEIICIVWRFFSSKKNCSSAESSPQIFHFRLLCWIPPFSVTDAGVQPVTSWNKSWITGCETAGFYKSSSLRMHEKKYCAKMQQLQAAAIKQSTQSRKGFHTKEFYSLWYSSLFRCNLQWKLLNLEGGRTGGGDFYLKATGTFAFLCNNGSFSVKSVDRQEWIKFLRSAWHFG